VEGRDGVDAFRVGDAELVDESLQHDTTRYDIAIAIAVLVSPGLRVVRRTHGVREDPAKAARIVPEEHVANEEAETGERQEGRHVAKSSPGHGWGSGRCLNRVGQESRRHCRYGAGARSCATDRAALEFVLMRGRVGA
jgi:hypothetical protein